LFLPAKYGASRHIFGYPGDGINGVFGALNRADGKIQFIQARHEEMAAFMASAYAKFSGAWAFASRPRALAPPSDHRDCTMRCWITSQSLAIVGQQARNALGGQYQQELDLVSMFKDVASAYVAQASSPAQVPTSDRSRRADRAVAPDRDGAIILPNDLQDEPYEEPPRAHGTLHSGVGYAAEDRAP
jgi:pyruvate dehydrogenase (quinone)